jgi:hypothetical protein
VVGNDNLLLILVAGPGASSPASGKGATFIELDVKLTEEITGVRYNVDLVSAAISHDNLFFVIAGNVTYGDSIVRFEVDGKIGYLKQGMA